ncbi:MAG: cohesin domain-containing protein, partial [Ignavibacteria bacterium]|nr:cohesin domain-containing protein [Ignavibacteria bacterium]
PIDAKNLKSVGALSLKIKYNAALLTFSGVSNAASGISFTSNASNGIITLGWFDATGNSPLNLGDAKLVDLNFTILSGSGSLEFLTAQCEISDSLGQVVSGVNYVNGSVLTVALPAVPVLASPVNGALGQPVSVVLKWGAAQNATSYQVQVSKDSLFSTFVRNDSTIIADSLVVDSLLNDTKYFWKVKAINAAGLSNFSSVFNFKTIVKIAGVPVLVSPVINAIDQLLPVVIKWNSVAGATRYHVQVSTTGFFTTFVKNDSTITADSLVLPSLQNNSKYFWRVRSLNAAGASSFSTIFNFKTIVAIPAAPLLVSPLNATIVASDSLKLVWYGVPGATNYKLQVAKSNTFNPVWLEKSSLTDTSVVISNYDSTGTYYWRVYAGNIAGTSNASSVWNFKTLIVGIFDIDQIPTTYTLSQNFPNPFNPTTVIRYDLPKEGLVTLKVYDMLGKEVKVLVNQSQSVGKYS